MSEAEKAGPASQGRGARRSGIPDLFAFETPEPGDVPASSTSALELRCEDFREWKDLVRRLWTRKVSPQHVRWIRPANTPGLFETAAPDSRAGWRAALSAGGADSLPRELADNEEVMQWPASGFSVPARFAQALQKASCHGAPDLWDLLYRLSYRVVNGQRNLLADRLDPDVAELERRLAQVHRAAHKMKAFLRFRKMPGEVAYWVAWFEPLHPVVPIVAPFFMRRFPNSNWSIWTPAASAHGIDGSLCYGSGSPWRLNLEDAFDEYWKTYYRSTFNPARVNHRLMVREMPRHYWKNLPEADLIHGLEGEARNREHTMLVAQPSLPDQLRLRSKGVRAFQDQLRDRSDSVLSASTPVNELSKLRAAASACQSCPLHHNATQTVFGEGPASARLMIVGEQPGDQEDRQGRPFVGPAGQLLDAALHAAGIQRADCYITNSVKHFKWKPAGSRRLHATPSARDVAACAHWLDAELAAIRPDHVLALGKTAAERLLNRSVQMSSEAGTTLNRGATKVSILQHPAWLLRQAPALRASAIQKWNSQLAQLLAD